MKLIIRHPDKGYLDTWLWVPKRWVNEDGTKNALSFMFTDQHAPGHTRILYLWKETDHHLLVPREFFQLKDLPFEVIDCRPIVYESVGISSSIKLDHHPVTQLDGSKKLEPTYDDVQKQSIEKMLKAMGGVLQLGCGKGKTVVALHLISLLNVPTLIVIDNTQLIEQWKKEIEKHLVVPGGVGLIQAETFDWKKAVVLSTYHTLANRAATMPEEVRRWFGIIVWDEAHHIAAPTFAKSADLFYGRRYGLTATPIRDDGLHIVYDFHIGRVLHKDLSQEVKPKIVFKWTSLQLNALARGEVSDKNGELHLSKLSGYYGKWPERLSTVLNDVKTALDNKRKVLVLCNSVDEVVNLTTLWACGRWDQGMFGQHYLYTDIQVPTPIDVGETLSPLDLNKKERATRQRKIEAIEKQLVDPTVNPTKKQNLDAKRAELLQQLKQAEVQDKIMSELRRRQKEYIKRLVDLLGPSNAGMMIFKVKPAIRKQYVKDKAVVFAITKYGKEALDWPELDTILISMPFSSRNGLQQVMGRPTRHDDQKKSPLVIFYEDNIGSVIGMCKKLRDHLLSWPLEDGGPFDYELHEHPRAKWKKSTGSLFG